MRDFIHFIAICAGGGAAAAMVICFPLASLETVARMGIAATVVMLLAIATRPVKP